MLNLSPFLPKKATFATKKNEMALVYLGLGTNMGNKVANMESAIQAISLEVGVVMEQSALYDSKPWGFKSENNFLNAAVLVETSLTPTQLLIKTQALEIKIGRSAKTKTGYADRLIDIDILLYDNIILNEPALKIPHLLLHKRDFVLIPLAEIAPDFVHPILQKTIKELCTSSLTN